MLTVFIFLFFWCVGGRAAHYQVKPTELPEPNRVWTKTNGLVEINKLIGPKTYKTELNGLGSGPDC